MRGFYRTPFILGISVFFTDFLFKWYTSHYLPLMRNSWSWYPYGGIGVFKNFFGIEFSLTHQINSGAAWGLFSQYQVPLLYFRIFLIASLLIYSIWFNPYKNWRIPFALIIAGALGNICDYYLYGHVIDMFHFVLWGYDCPIFNVADSAIFIGVVGLGLARTSIKNSPSRSLKP